MNDKLVSIEIFITGLLARLKALELLLSDKEKQQYQEIVLKQKEVFLLEHPDAYETYPELLDKVFDV